MKPEELDAIDSVRGTAVFLLGAGCSADVGIPLMSRFMERARALERTLSPGQLKEAYADAINFWRNCASISKIFDRWWDDIEQLYTQAELNRIVEETSDNLSRNISLMIWDVCRQPFVSGPGGYGLFAKALFSLSKPQCPRPVVITTNYDVCLELAATQCRDFEEADGRLEISYPSFFQEVPGFPDHRRVQQREAGRIRTVEVIKLHGSANWLVKKEEPDKCELQWEVTPESIPRMYRFQDRGFEEGLGDRRPLIIPPALSKAADHPVIVSQWQRAVHALSNAREIIVAGYSFPETDVFMSRLLAEGVRKNKSLNRIAVVDYTSKDEWWDRIKRMFSGSWLANCVDLLECPFFGFANVMSAATLRKSGISPIEETIGFFRRERLPPRPAIVIRS